MNEIYKIRQRNPHSRRSRVQYPPHWTRSRALSNSGSPGNFFLLSIILVSNLTAIVLLHTKISIFISDTFQLPSTTMISSLKFFLGRSRSTQARAYVNEVFVPKTIKMLSSVVLKMRFFFLINEVTPLF